MVADALNSWWYVPIAAGVTLGVMAALALLGYTLRAVLIGFCIVGGWLADGLTWPIRKIVYRLHPENEPLKR